MFDNIGGKIKALAQVICWIGIIVSVISGFVMMTDEDLVFRGLIIMIIGSLVSWVSSFVLYGFGELIDKTTAIADIVKPNSAKKIEATETTHITEKKEEIIQPLAEGMKRCPLCGFVQSEENKCCEKCGSNI